MSNTEIVFFFLFLSLIVAESVQDEIFLNTPITKTGESANYHFTLQFPLSSYTLLTITTTPNDPANPAYIYVSQTESSPSKETATYSSEKDVYFPYYTWNSIRNCYHWRSSILLLSMEE